MKTLTLDTNALYDLERKPALEPKIKAALGRGDFNQVALTPIVLVEAMTKSYEDRKFFKDIIKPSIKKAKRFSPKIFVDQDVLFDKIAEKDPDIFSQEQSWTKIVNNISDCDFEGDSLVYKTNGVKRLIKVDYVTSERAKYEKQYANDWHSMLKLVNPSYASELKINRPISIQNQDERDKLITFLSSPDWNKAMVDTFNARASSLVEPSRNNEILNFMRYMKEEYEYIWKKCVTDGYRPFSDSKANDYHDMHLLLYAAIDDIFLLSRDGQMIKKNSAKTDGKVIDVEDFIK